MHYKYYLCNIRKKNMEQIVEKYINPLTDFGFKRIFGTEFNKELLISFLNALFEGKEDIEQ